MPVSKIEIEDIINNSQKILVGIGEEFSNEQISYESSYVYQIFEEKRKKESNEVDWMLDTIKNHYINSEMSIDQLQTGQAYKELLNKIKHKDYFIINMNPDGLLKKIGFNEEKIVNPCGIHNLYQCSDNCNNKIIDADEIDKELIQMICDEQIKLGEIKRPRCKQCGEILVYNRVENSNYCEEGYLDRWKKYTEWTSQTLNQDGLLKRLRLLIIKHILLE